MLSSRNENFKPQAKFSTWLYTIARNTCISKIRKRKSIFSISFGGGKEDDSESFDIPDPKPTPNEELQKKEIAHQIKKAIHRLPLVQKEAIVLREYNELSYGEIAQILKTSLENVKILIFRAREKLRKELAPMIKEGQI